MRITISMQTIKNAVGETSGQNYWKIQTDQGVMTCFEKSIIDKLSERLQNGQFADVEMVQNEKGFKNIRAFYDAPETVSQQMDRQAIPQETVHPPAMGKTTIPEQKAKYEPTSMYVSYAKDIFIDLVGSKPYGKSCIDDGKELTVEDLMKKSIELVKQAKEAFS